MQETTSTIRRVEILGLYGNRNISLDFKYPVKILVDANGTGKTTVIYLLVNLLQGNWSRITRYRFDSVMIYFENEQSIKIMEDEIRAGLSALSAITQLPEEILQMYSTEIRRASFAEIRARGLLDDLAAETGLNIRELYEFLLDEPTFRRERIRAIRQRTLFDDNVDTGSTLSTKLAHIQRLFPYEILYFPTYRLVEENLPNLGYARRRSPIQSEQLIQFGMKSVQDRFNRITDEIRKSAVESFNRINGRMLGQLINGIQKDSIDYRSLGSPDALRIVLDRVGDNIRSGEKEHILRLIEQGRIDDESFVPLAYFLSNLIQIYDKQKTNDEAIKAFANVVNGYLDDKHIDYDESKLEILVVNNRTDKDMSLETLSSGEKQIISIFSKLYLDSSGPFAIFFDEPELSLSMEWQRKLLQDIVDSENCAFLVAATHSPFIFENELAKYAGVLHIEFVEDEDGTG